MVRILRSTLMVRVGGGWTALDEFLVKNDPCRGEVTITFCLSLHQLKIIRILKNLIINQALKYQMKC